MPVCLGNFKHIFGRFLRGFIDVFEQLTTSKYWNVVKFMWYHNRLNMKLNISIRVCILSIDVLNGNNYFDPIVEYESINFFHLKYVHILGCLIYMSKF